METEADTNVEVTITINAAEVVSLVQHGEILAHPNEDGVPKVAVTTDFGVADLYEDEADAVAVVAPYDDIQELVDSDSERDDISYTIAREGDYDEPHVHIHYDEDAE
jgi:hypothetical protein